MRRLNDIAFAIVMFAILALVWIVQIFQRLVNDEPLPWEIEDEP
jgi:TRAP-type C4-dicarboxylate transport system permease small subunit